MSKVLIISGHPNSDGSNANRFILNTIKQSIDDVEIRYLDKLYPDFQIDVKREQDALIASDIIVLQFPFYWYSIPALLKKWIDEVFAYDFAFGTNGDKLKGKDLILSFTVGGPEESYDPLGYNHFSIEQLIYPLQQTAYLTGLNFIQPVYTHRMVYIEGVYNKLDDVQNRAACHAQKLLNRIGVQQKSVETQVKKFIKHWFANFDKLPDNSEFFTNHLSEEVILLMPEGEFTGHSGFRDWYQAAKATFQANCEHVVEQFTVNKKGVQSYHVELRVRLIAETYKDSQFQGKQISLLVNEHWELCIKESHHIEISRYVVDVVK
ncbi:NAD(P)H-dependent oxidoreductase [Pseudoalteromonas luteoviolacea]|uniref:NAD(P)H-dependent oxidoreductase n=1 Tax=Pseudoalteromonas luteoviolacea TaxID=43657 RepID=UPI00114F792B|nr:NAD(P)H-dependent oxidoreductase [Pseudoalteromonas luteoviolacea]TQF70781.1 NAD(P)H-dependent oxidoreductase [Pseudoalteromonas luteoviolacea]